MNRRGTKKQTTTDQKVTVAISIRESILARVKESALLEDRNVSSMFATLVNEALQMRGERAPNA